MRVVSLLASGTEIVVGLGAGEWLVGRSHECDNPPWVTELPVCTRPAFDVSMSSGRIDAEVRRRLKAGEPLYHVDTELINSLKPDLLITQEHCEVCAVTPADVKRAGCVAAVQVLALRAGNVQGILDGIFSIGRALGREEDAANLVGAMKSRISAVHSAVKHHRAPSLVALEWTDPVFAMGNWGPELVEAANGRLVLGEKGEFSKAIDWQRVRDADPEWLIIAPCGFDLERTMREATDAGSAAGLVRPARGAAREGGAGRRQQVLQSIRDHDRGDGGDPGGNPARIFGRPPRQSLGELLRAPGNGADPGAACARLREQPAHLYRSCHGIRRVHGRFLEATGLLLRQRLPALPLPGRRRAHVDAEQPIGPSPTMMPVANSWWGCGEGVAGELLIITGTWREKGTSLNSTCLTPKPLASSVYVHVPEAPSPHERSISVMSIFSLPDVPFSLPRVSVMRRLPEPTRGESTTDWPAGPATPPFGKRSRR